MFICHCDLSNHILLAISAEIQTLPKTHFFLTAVVVGHLVGFYSDYWVCCEGRHNYVYILVDLVNLIDSSEWLFDAQPDLS